MEENAAPFTKQSVESMLNKIASNRKYSPTLPSEPPKQANEEAFQDLMNNSPENTEGPGPHVPNTCLLYTSPSPRDRTRSRMPSSA